MRSGRQAAKPRGIYADKIYVYEAIVKNAFKVSGGNDSSVVKLRPSLLDAGRNDFPYVRSRQCSSRDQMWVVGA